MQRAMRRLSLLALSVFLLAPFTADAAQRARPMAKADVEKAVSAYAKSRGLRVGKIDSQVAGLTGSGKSTRATLNLAGEEVSVAINHGSGRVQTSATGSFVGALLRAHEPYQRSEAGGSSAFATRLRAFRPGVGAQPLARLALGRSAPLGRPRAGQPVSMQSLDVLSLGERGSVELELGTGILSGRPGAALRVRENGLGAGPDILNQTPGLVEVLVGQRWYRLGYAGYKTAGDTLRLANALDSIPPGHTITRVRVTDAPRAPHPKGFDITDNAVASARGVKGFDLVSVEGLPGLSR